MIREISSLEEFEKQTASELNISLDIVEKVIRHKWSVTHDALSFMQSVEDSGLGKFSIRKKKVINRVRIIESILEKLFTFRLKLNDLTKYESMILKLQEEKKYLLTKI